MTGKNGMFEGLNQDPRGIIQGVLDRCLTAEGFDHLNLYQPRDRALTALEKEGILAALLDYSRREIYWHLGRALDPEEFQWVLERVKGFMARRGIG